jgi:ribosome-binding protein aMBF1 (putative translation factor)
MTFSTTDGGGRTIQSRSEYGTPEFEAEYQELVADRRARRQKGKKCHGLSGVAYRTTSGKKDEGASEMGKNVRHLRIAAGLTQTVLAKRPGTDRTHLSRLERGRLMPTFPTLKRLATTLQVTPRSLLDG